MKLVLACATMGAAQAFVTPSAFTGTTLSSARTSTGSTRMSLADYKEELAATAKKIAGPGKFTAARFVRGERRVCTPPAACLKYPGFYCPGVVVPFTHMHVLRFMLRGRVCVPWVDDARALPRAYDLTHRVSKVPCTENGDGAKSLAAHIRVPHPWSSVQGRCFGACVLRGVGCEFVGGKTCP